MNKNEIGTSSLIKFLVFSIISITAVSAGLADPIDDTRNVLKEWVSVEKTISQEQMAWDREKALLDDVLSSLGQEERILRETIDAAQVDTSRADEERLELTTRRDQYQQSSNLLQERLSLYERQARQLIPRLPKLLKDEMGLMINKLYLAEEGSYSLSERSQNLISILSAIQDFDSNITVASEIRTLDSGQQKEVKVLFLGLSRAFYADPAKSIAGIGHPIEGGSEDGWQWTQQNDLADEIIKAVDIYENRESPSLINLPLDVEVN